MSMKDVQEQLADAMRKWRKIEEASVANTGKIIEKTKNPLIRLVMEIIQADSKTHRKVQKFLLATLEEKAVELSVDELAAVWDGIERHNEIERNMVGFVEEILAALKGKRMIVQEYLLHYLQQDEKKHENLLAALEKIKKGMYPYAS